MRSRTLYVNVLVVKAAGHVEKGLKASKFASNREGLYIVCEAYDNDYFLISRPNFDDLLAPINAKWLQL